MKIILQTKSSDDFGPIANAGEHYAKTLDRLIAFQNKSQQHVHKSILEEFRYTVFKKLTVREKPVKPPKLKMELHTAFVLRDAFQNYIHTLTGEDDAQEAAQVRRLTMDLYSLLPRTEDQEDLSLMSTI
tara:strand:- start:936 stop:1322 length:387 start_codon:yes stop_codon:yes gene_type:complete